MNTISIDGRIISQLKVRKTNLKGLSVLNFKLRHTEKRQKNVLFVDVEVWGSQAERLAKDAEEGSYVVVHGELRRDVWEKTTDEGEAERRSKIKIKAHKVIVGSERERESHFDPQDDETNLSF